MTPGPRGGILGLLVAVGLLAAACGSTTSPTATPGSEAPATAGPGSSSPVATATADVAPSTPTVVVPTPTLTPDGVPQGSASLPDGTLAARLAGQAKVFLETFTSEFSPRASGTDQELAAAEYLAGALESMGFAVVLQPFEVGIVSSDLRLEAPGAADLPEPQNIPLTLSGLGQASGSLVHVGEAREGDLPAQDIQGKIALARRGTITFEAKVDRLAEAGASAAVIYNNRPGLFRGTLVEESSIPVVSISAEAGATLLDLLSSGEVEATVAVILTRYESHNVVAERRGSIEGGGMVILGGHYDTVPDVPGANDNGSGIATLITVASEVSERDYPFTLRLIAFGMEELGLHGSSFHVGSLSSEERESTIAMLNFDALGTGDVTGVLGDAELRRAVLEIAANEGIAAEARLALSAGTSSDHAPFRAAGVPILFFLADEFSRIHTPEDRAEFVRPELMGGSAALAIGLLDSLAQP